MSTNLARFTDKQLRLAIKKARQELARRNAEKWALKGRVGAGMAGMANFMAGVTWALACRQSLRRSKEHTPDTGKRPASGEMWLPKELLYAARHEVKERQWTPLTQDYASQVIHNLRVEAAKAGYTPPEVGAVAFHVKMAAPQYGAVYFNALTGRS